MKAIFMNIVNILKRKIWVLCIFSSMVAMEVNKKAKIDHISPLTQIEQKLLGQIAAEDELCLQAKFSTPEEYCNDAIQTIKTHIKNYKIKRTELKKEYLEKEGLSAEMMLQKRLSLPISSQAKYQQYTQAGNKLATEFSDTLNSFLSYHLTAAFDPDYPAYESYTKKHKKFLLYQGIKTNLLKEATIDNEGRVHFAPDVLSRKIAPLRAAIQLQSIRSFVLLDRNYDNLHLSEFPVKTAQLQIENQKNQHIDTRKPESILMMLKAISNSFVPEDYSKIPIPQQIIEKLKITANKEVPSLQSLCSNTVLSMAMLKGYTTFNTLNDFKKNISNFENISEFAQNSILSAAYSKINYFNPQFLKQLSLKESVALKQFWNYKLQDLCEQAREVIEKDDQDDDTRALIEFSQMLDKYGFLNQKGNFNSEKYDSLWKEFTKELGLYKKKFKSKS